MGLFDVNPKIIGNWINDVEVMDCSRLEEYVRKEGIDIGIICTTKNSGQEVADKLCAGGVRGIWNFTALDVNVPEGVALENVHLSDSLHSLAYYMENK
jgi:redox-sensing transcriptional repressor